MGEAFGEVARRAGVWALLVVGMLLALTGSHAALLLGQTLGGGAAILVGVALAATAARAGEPTGDAPPSP